MADDIVKKIEELQKEKKRRDDEYEALKSELEEIKVSMINQTRSQKDL